MGSLPEPERAPNTAYGSYTAPSRPEQATSSTDQTSTRERTGSTESDSSEYNLSLPALPARREIGRACDPTSDFDSLFDDVDTKNDLFGSSQGSQNSAHENNRAGEVHLLRDTRAPEAQATTPEYDEIGMSDNIATANIAVGYNEHNVAKGLESSLGPDESYGISPGVGSPEEEEEEEEQITRFKYEAYHPTVSSIHPHLLKDQQTYLDEEVRRALETEKSAGHEQVISGKHTSCCSKRGPQCACGPLDCRCIDCDHNEEVDKQASKMMQNEPAPVMHDRREEQDKCSCLPGLCHCPNCTEHSQNENGTQDHHPIKDFVQSSSTIAPAVRHNVDSRGQRGFSGRGEVNIKSEFQPVPEKVMTRLEDKIAYKRTSTMPEESKATIYDFYHSIVAIKPNEDTGLGGQVLKTELSDFTRTAPPSCSCANQGICTCIRGSCRCASRVAANTKRLYCDGEYCSRSPGTSRCGRPSHVEQLNREPQPTLSLISAQQHSQRGYLPVSELAGAPTAQESPSASLSKFQFDKLVSAPPSRPDTPRPLPDTTPSTPYASEIRPNDRHMKLESIRQSVEPELPAADWTRESTPAYEDRSSTPSPTSTRADVEMIDTQHHRGAMTMSTISSIKGTAVSNTRRVSPKMPPVPHIPTTTSPIKVSKRDDRRKSVVQGSKVDKRSATNSITKGNARSKSRNFTKRLNAASVVQAVPGIHHGPTTAGAGGSGTRTAAQGKVAAAVADIEERVNNERAEKDAPKQKDGTPVRRSQRKTKGRRISLS